MTGRYNYTAPTNASSFDPPGDISDAYAFFDGLLGEKAASAGSLPAPATRPVGHLASVDDTNAIYRNTGTAWVRFYPVFASQQGVVTCPGTGGASDGIGWSDAITVSFAAGRFTAAPYVWVQTMGPVDQICLGGQVQQITSSGCKVRGIRVGSVPTTEFTVRWYAVQMVSGSAAG